MNMKIVPANIFRFLARSGKSPYAQKVSDQAIEAERFKLEGHQWGLAIAILPAAISFAELSSNVSAMSLFMRTLISWTVCISSFAAVLKVGLIQVSRARVRDYLNARVEGKNEIKSRYIRLKTLFWSDTFSILAYLGLVFLAAGLIFSTETSLGVGNADAP